MNTVISDAPQVKALPLEKVISYVERAGWKHIPHPNQNLIVFQGSNDDLGKPIQLVLPRSIQLWDSSILLDKAINLIAAVEEKTPEEIRTAIQRESDFNEESFESAPNQLIGEALIQKVNQLSHLSRQEIARQSGYYTVTRNNETRVNLIEFYDALLAAKDISLNPKKLKDNHDPESANRVTVDKNAQIVIGASYTQAIGLKPGDKIEVKLISEQILLSRIGDALNQ